MDPAESTGLRNSILNSYSLFSDLPLKVSVSSARMIDASFTSVSAYEIKKMMTIERERDRTQQVIYGIRY